MSIAVYALRPEATYDPRVPFDLARLRDQLLAERTVRGLSRAALAETSGINKTTIQSAEKGPDMPGIDTVAKLIEAMPGLTLSDFFLRVEEDVSSEERLRRAAFSLQTRETLIQNASHVSGAARANGRNLDAAADPHVDEAVAKILAGASKTIRHRAISSALFRAATSLHVEAITDRQRAVPAAAKASRRQSK